MQTKQLGDSDMHLTRIGVGAWAMGGPNWAFSWGPQDDGDSIAATRAALDAGINWIDTAAVYGLGHSEEVVAKAIEGVTPRPYVFTKCARNWDENGNIIKLLKRDAVRKECENSLRRLRTDVIDLYQIHWPEPDEDLEEGWETLAKLKEEGKVRYIGVSNCSVQQMERVRKIAPVTSTQPPYSIIQPEAEQSILPYAAEHRVGVIVYAPMKSGLLTGGMTRERLDKLPPDDWRRRSPFFQEPILSRSFAVVEVMRQIGARLGKSPGEVAIAWTLRHPAVTAAIVGVRSPQQLQGVVGAVDLELSQDGLDEIAKASSVQPA